MGSNVLLSQDFSASKFSMIILTTIQSGPGPAPPRQQHHQRRRRAPCRPAGRDPGSRRASPCTPVSAGCGLDATLSSSPGNRPGGRNRLSGKGRGTKSPAMISLPGLISHGVKVARLHEPGCGSSRVIVQPSPPAVRVRGGTA